MKKSLALIIATLCVFQCFGIFVSAADFTDVPPAAYFYEAVEWAVENGVTSGKTETTFAPTKAVPVLRRYHLCTVLQATPWLTEPTSLLLT